MSVPLLTPANVPQIVARIEKLKPGAQRRWGTLDAPGMLRHLRRACELSLGNDPIEDQSNLFTRTVMRFLALYVIPWPKGKIKAPDHFTPPAEGDVASEFAKLKTELQRFAETAAREPGRIRSHPFFGKLTLATWSRVHGLHIDHHCKQFGI